MRARRTAIPGSLRHTVHPVHKKTPTFGWGFGSLLGDEPRAIANPLISRSVENYINPCKLGFPNPYPCQNSVSYLYPYVHKWLYPCVHD